MASCRDSSKISEVPLGDKVEKATAKSKMSRAMDCKDKKYCLLEMGDKT